MQSQSVKTPKWLGEVNTVPLKVQGFFSLYAQVLLLIFNIDDIPFSHSSANSSKFSEKDVVRKLNSAIV